MLRNSGLHSKSPEDSSSSEQSEPKSYKKAHCFTINTKTLTKNQNQQIRNSNSSEEQSLSEEDSSPAISERKDEIKQIIGKGKEPQDSEEQDKSIDQIEQRIKRLQKDLENRIDKHKSFQRQEKNHQNSVDNIKAIKKVSSPPFPKKTQTRPISKPVSSHRKVDPYAQTQHAGSNIQHTQIGRKGSRKLANQQMKLPTPKKKHVKQTIEEKKMDQKQRTDTKNSSRQDPGCEQQLRKANREIEQLHQLVDELRRENRCLHEELNSGKERKEIFQVGRLRQLGSGVKLQKQLQLLKVIESLQSKLKRSIQRKLGKSKGTTTSAVLLHKGLPASLFS